MKSKKEEQAAPPPLTKDQELLAEIRDLLQVAGLRRVPRSPSCVSRLSGRCAGRAIRINCRWDPRHANPDGDRSWAFEILRVGRARRSRTRRGWRRVRWCPIRRSRFPAVFLRTPTRYPLVYRKRVRRVDDQARPGDLVAVYSEPEGERAELIGYGLYNPRSEIVVRIVRFAPELPDGRVLGRRSGPRAASAARRAATGRGDRCVSRRACRSGWLFRIGRRPVGRHAQRRGVQPGDVSAVSARF